MEPWRATNGEVIYSPSSGESIIRDKLANFEKFINEDDSLDPLIKMAIMHYQFEAIHPLSDGNGRTGWILLLLYLKMKKLLDISAIYLSEYIIKNKPDYYKKLRDITSEKIKIELPKVYSKDLIQIIFKLPYTKRQFLINAGLGTLKTIGNYLVLLEEKGFLIQ